MNLKYESGEGAITSVLTGCKLAGCHATISSVDYPGSTTTPRGVQTATEAYLDTLTSLLGQRGWIDTVSTSANFGQVKLTGGKLVIRPAIKAGAIYNLFFVEHDLSGGVHNTKYAIDLLKSSIAELRKP